MGTQTYTHKHTPANLFFFIAKMLQLFFLSYHLISSPKARNFSNLTRKHNESFLCMLYIIFLIFLFSFLPPVLLLRLFFFFFLNIHFYPKVSSIKISHPFIHPFIRSFVHLFIHTLSVSFSLSLSPFSFQPRFHLYALNCLFCFSFFFRRVKLLISKYIFLLIL